VIINKQKEIEMKKVEKELELMRTRAATENCPVIASQQERDYDEMAMIGMLAISELGYDKMAYPWIYKNGKGRKFEPLENINNALELLGNYPSASIQKWPFGPDDGERWYCTLHGIPNCEGGETMQEAICLAVAYANGYFEDEFVPDLSD